MGITRNGRADSAAKAALQKFVQSEWDMAVMNRPHATQPLDGEHLSA